MQVAIENFSKIHAEKKIVILGSMAELGEESKKEHEQIIDLIGKHAFEKVVLVGEQFGQLNHPYIQFSTSKEAAAWYHAQTFENTHFLIKGSRSMKMETILA
jgi:UDP-N-acetylmuramoyl-tripeptide--D-alanyl-D-alanine ligase